MARINIAHGAARPAGLGPSEPWLDDATGIMYVGDRPVTGGNRNILVNGDFQVNQRGQSRYTEAGYTVDMWMNGSANGSAQIVDNGLTWTMPNPGMGAMYQLIEQYKDYAGKLVTASVECPAVADTSKWRLYVHDGIAGTNQPITHAGIISTSLLVSENATRLAVYLLNDSADNTPITTSRAKLELGPISTLALDGPADYGAELLRCQRYYVNYPNRIYLPGASNNIGAFFYALADLPTTMRIAPTVSSGNGIQLDVGGKRPEASIAYTGIVHATTSRLTLKYTPTTAIPASQAGVILVESLAFSAEL